MKYQEANRRVAEYRREIAALREKMRLTQAKAEPQEVRDYEFAVPSGTRKLSSFFAGKDTLILIHNMGTSCPSCTMWADGFNGVYPHLLDRAGFVLTSPDPPEMQQRFAEARGWKFPMASHQGTSFAADMGYARDGRALPGVSVFERKGAKILRVADTGFDAGDDFCCVWRFLELTPEGATGWRPKFSYTD
jgi:predicted dithiol-disulfide oxidoreductase (DUF899 family)